MKIFSYISRYIVVAAATIIAAPSLLPLAAQSIDLKGQWRFTTGSHKDYDDTITLPGSMLTNGKGNEVTIRTQWTGSLYDSSFYFNPYMEKYRRDGQCKFPFFLTPNRHYTGHARYGRTIFIPKKWKKGRIFISLERPHIETTVMVNGQRVGKDSTLSVPHVFEITQYAKPGHNNDIDIDIYNGIENVCVGQDSHSVTDQTQGNWNGIAGDIRLLLKPSVFISNVQVYPDIHDKSIRVEYEIDGAGERCAVMASAAEQKFCKLSLTRNKRGRYTTIIPLGDDIKLWDEFSPNLYCLKSVLNGDTLTTTFGMREITVKGRQMYINGRPMWVRGTVDNCCFPLTGYPPTDEKQWTEIFEKCRQYGINHVRFHSYCPPEAAFDAADKIGIYLQPEGPSWPNHGVRLKRGMTIDRYLLEETERMVREYGNHPSFCMMAAGNEPAGDWVTWCREFVDYWHATGDNRRIYCGASVGGGWAWDVNSDYHVKGGARGLEWNRSQPQSADDYYEQLLLPRNFKTKGVPDRMLASDTLADGTVRIVNNSPIIAHEQGQWCAFPDLSERNQYTGAYKAGNMDIFEDLLKTNGMASMARPFLMASGRLQTLAYKYEIERNLRTRDYSGFQLLGLNDYSGQGSAMVGLLNVFWKEKGYCDSTLFRQFCSPLVPLALFPRFVYTNSDSLCVDIEAYNACRSGLTNIQASYKIISASGKNVAAGRFDVGNVALGKDNMLGIVTADLKCFAAPAKYTLVVDIMGTDDEQQTITGANQWDFWVYPTEQTTPAAANAIYITDSLDTKAIEVLSKGGDVLITAAGKVTLGSDVVQHYLPIFWNTSWFKMRPPHTTGAVIDNSHPLFKQFPTDDWANINWWELLNRAQVINLCELPDYYQSPIQPIDTWHVSRKLGMLVEARCMKGRVLITTMDVTNHLSRRHVARQMRQALLAYMTSNDFQPQMSLTAETISHFFTKQAAKVDMYTKDSPDELKPKIK
ncbi:MAG: glycoside hydrolase family 2 TIM barrel-domain containing protein [Prevotellaceae bacterium]|nr:glycoside hydrolase family 2 TIM barrel-domain containing protein [Prevotellaceae bacterium]